MPAIERGQPTRKGKSGKGARSGGPRGPAAKSTAKPTRTPARRGPAVYAGEGRFSGLSPRLTLTVATATLGLALVLLLTTGGRGRAIADTMARGADVSLGRAGFAVKQMHVEGASKFSEADILKSAHVAPGQPILGLDLDRIHDQVEKVGWVKTVRVFRMLPDTLVIAVTERPRLAVWQHNGQLGLIDAEGQTIPEADPNQFADLPLVVGEGANTAASGVITLMQARPRLLALTDALVRVDSRRWDVRLKDGSLIQLPAEGEDAALIRLDQLDRDQGVLRLGFSRIDLRNPDPIVRPRATGETASAAASGVG